MRPQTRRAVEALKAAGLTRSQFRIRTPWKSNGKGYRETTIELVCPYTQIAPYLPKLAKTFRVVVTLFEGIPSHVSIEVSGEIGLYKAEHGKTEPVKEIPMNGSYQQLTFAEIL